jgi:hypothetical protein
MQENIPTYKGCRQYNNTNIGVHKWFLQFYFISRPAVSKYKPSKRSIQ